MWSQTEHQRCSFSSRNPGSAAVKQGRWVSEKHSEESQRLFTWWSKNVVHLRKYVRQFSWRQNKQVNKDKQAASFQNKSVEKQIKVMQQFEFKHQNNLFSYKKTNLHNTCDVIWCHLYWNFSSLSLPTGIHFIFKEIWGKHSFYFY